MNLYVVRNKEGKFLRAKGRDGGGDSWVDTIEKAKFYPKAGTAKGQASFWFKAYPQYGCPEILVFDLDPTKATVLDITAETSEKIRRATVRADKRRRAYEAWRNAEPSRP